MQVAALAEGRFAIAWNDANGGLVRAQLFNIDGTLLSRFGASENMAAEGALVAPHGICADSRGDIYVPEVTDTFGVNAAMVQRGTV